MTMKLTFKKDALRSLGIFMADAAEGDIPELELRLSRLSEDGGVFVALGEAGSNTFVTRDFNPDVAEVIGE